MPDNIINQCKRLYIDAFHDDEQFTDLLFDLFYESSCKYLLEDGVIFSMLFAMDISLDGMKGKYIYAVATDEKYRGKGYMRRLFDKITAEFKKDYDFLCLKPMSESLFDYYSRLGFVRGFKKSVADFSEANIVPPLTFLDNTKDIKNVRKAILSENYVEYTEDFLKLLLSYCDMLTDSIENPTVFAVREKLSGKVKEVLGDITRLTDEFKGIPLLLPGEEFDFAMIKFLKNKRFENKYLGFALD